MADKHILDWDILKSRYIVNDRWLRLRADTCRTPRGLIVEPYYVLEYPAWVVVVAVTGDDRIVLVRQYRHGIRKTVLGLPCGNVEENESVAEAAGRELLEETGYTAESIIETGRISPNPANHSNLTYCFVATDVSATAAPRDDDGEEVEVISRPLGEALTLIEQGDITHSLHISAIFLALNKLDRLRCL